MFGELKYLVNQLVELLPHAKFYLAGGCVRDALLDEVNGFDSPSIKDFDVEVFGVQPAQLTEAFFKLGVAYDEVGQSFGVYKVYVNGHTFDFSFPRSETKTGQGYRGFDVYIDPFLSPEMAASRRDLTMNAIMYDLKENKYFDFFGGVRDIIQGVMRPTTKAFKEDPLRVLRAFQFGSRFGFKASDQLARYCLELLSEKNTLTPERVWVEWEKWATKSRFPSMGIDFLVWVLWAETEITDLIEVQQDPTHHPEGDAFIHTLRVVDAAKEICNRERLNEDETIILMLAALCHDFGKANTTFFHEKKQKWVAYNHQRTGIPLTESFLEKINCPQKYRRPILTLVYEHMVHLLEEPTPKNVRKLINRLVEGKTTLRMLTFVTEADNSGRPPLPKGISTRFLPWLKQADELNLSGEAKVPPLVSGDELISLGMKEGKELGDLLKWFYEEQMCGRLTPENKTQFITKKIKI
jgi:tRNA nucleotidyltransferase (CCA-adding enzyme)